jgi:hypothetical protein
MTRPEPRRVLLSLEDQHWAAIVGGRRQIEARHLGQRHAAGGNLDEWGNDLEGAGAELAAARALGVDWPAKVGAGLGWDLDVADGVEVRWTRNPHGPLLLRVTHCPPGHYVLVTGYLPRYLVLGYRDWPWPDPRRVPSAFDPARHNWSLAQDALEPIEQLEALCHPLARPSRRA